VRRLSVRLFGPVTYAWEDGPETRVGRKPAALVLARLALEPDRSLARGALKDELWGRRADEKNLRYALQRIGEDHKDLPVVVDERSKVRLTAGEVWVDVREFRKLLEEGKGYGQDTAEKYIRRVRAPGSPDFEGRSAPDCPSEALWRSGRVGREAGSGR
jgi:DNA-binding SARP family transcriptional activator